MVPAPDMVMSPWTRLMATMPPGSSGLASPPPAPDGRPAMKRDRACRSRRPGPRGTGPTPESGMGMLPSAGRRRRPPMSSAMGIMCPVRALLSTVGGLSLGRMSGVRLGGSSGRSRSWSSISPMGVTPPMGSFSNGKAMARAPISLPSM